MTNKLAGEQSPYLIRHSTNPVNWFPWSDEAFEIAEKSNKPVFLSIGYSSCHWCHVMEEESFKDQEIAQMLNNNFVCIKVDREERPDIDSIFMQVSNMLTGSGGWPLTIIMNPDKTPFLAGTYFPKENIGNKIGLRELIKRVTKVWREKNELVQNTADAVVQKLNIDMATSYGTVLTEDLFHKTYHLLMNSYDSVNGGFGDAPKFPTIHKLLFLLRYYSKYGDSFALEMSTNTLNKMRKSAMYDQVGSGFHRYSVSTDWNTPHFEKLLCDQALMIQAYSEAYQITQDELYKDTAFELFDYCCKHLSKTSSAFFTSEDADSNGKEGEFYLWDYKELKKDFSETELNFLTDYFNINENGNIQNFYLQGKQLNLLYLKDNFDEILEAYNYTQENLNIILNKLYAIRSLKQKPAVDDKILADWNGLMIASLAKAGIIFNNDNFIKKAESAADFILNKMYKDNILQHCYRNSTAFVPAMIDDYAFLAYGLSELYYATFNTKYLKAAIERTDFLIEHFYDENSGCFYMTSDLSETILIRKKEFYDGAIPSGQSIALLNLLKLCDLSGHREYENIASAIFDYLAGIITEMPLGFASIISAYFYSFHSDIQIVIADQSAQVDKKLLFNKLFSCYHPEKIILYAPTDKTDSCIFQIAPFLKNYKTINGKVTYNICHNFICNYPETDISKLKL